MSISALFNLILYQPLVNLLVLLYVFLPGHDFGVAVIFLTLIVRIILFPASLKSIISQRKLAILQPKIKEIQEKYKENKQFQSKAVMELYQKEKINPLSGCLPLVFQLPILIALYQVFLKGLNPESLNSVLYGFVPKIQEIDFTLLGLVDLSKPNIFLAVLAGALQFFQTKISTPPKIAGENKSGFSAIFQSQLLYFFPLLTIMIVWKFGSVIGLYWIVSTLFSIGEQYFIKRKIKN